MKDGKKKKILFITVIVLLIISVGYSFYRSVKRNPYRYSKIDIVIEEETEVPRTVQSDEIIDDSSDDNIFIERSEIIETIVGLPSGGTPIDTQSSVYIEDFVGNGVVNSDNIVSVLTDILRIEDVNSLTSYPVTSNLYNQLYNSNGVSETISSGSEIDMKVCGISSDNEIMCMFITQTSSYYMTVGIVNNQIDSIHCQELK